MYEEHMIIATLWMRGWVTVVVARITMTICKSQVGGRG